MILSPHESRRNARVGYSRCRQVNKKTLLSYYNRFKQCIDILTAVGETVPTNQVKAIDFMEDKCDYGDMMRDLKNRVRNNESTFPLTLTAAHEYARNYIPFQSRRLEGGQTATAFIAEEGNDNAVGAPVAITTITETKCRTCGRFRARGVPMFQMLLLL